MDAAKEFEEALLAIEAKAIDLVAKYTITGAATALLMAEMKTMIMRAIQRQSAKTALRIGNSNAIGTVIACVLTPT
ncbi:hypothetical protein QN379_19640 [Glaciimonas sp. Gout2]|uniref:hypothetical protein n=1 Tax=unclassified Glaciimonas TaxID=2644401 RepID=UPI002B23AAAE|nr:MULTISPECIES: hypothetical protein [unclassified Glaciimonas]MEB0014356.1 hypothetical protein [Glaciimonas sp. Cout2]MEB0084225.1 hypothetical protein [Glaciimonas sp. Gout2]